MYAQCSDLTVVDCWQALSVTMFPLLSTINENDFLYETKSFGDLPYS